MSTYIYQGELHVETCCHEKCHVTFGLDIAHYRQLQRETGTTFYCPNGHAQHYTGKSDEQKLREAEARETALRDQLEASIRDKEQTRQTLLRERSRIANGVCPCCNRFFRNVMLHMDSQHPEYERTGLADTGRYECGCGLSFDSWRGLRVHQGKTRGDDWAKPKTPAWRSHLTVVDA